MLLKVIIKKKTNFTTNDLNRGKFILTQDLDYIYRFSNIFKSIASLARELIYIKSIQGFLFSFYFFLISLFNYQKDPYLYGIKNIINKCNGKDIELQLYFMTYYLNKNKIKYIINDILDCVNNSKNNIIIGLHPSLNTAYNKADFDNEINQFNTYFNFKPKIVRQHFLQIDIETTFQIINQSEVILDSTLGYAEREGFRCGTCHLYNPFNFLTNEPYNFLEQPLIVMDTTLIGYQRLNTTHSFQNMVRLYETTKSVNGNFVVLWHNNNVTQQKIFTQKVLFKFIEYYTKSKSINAC